MKDNVNKLVLVVEDNIQYGQMLAEALSNYKYSTRLEFSATGGLDIIRREKVDIVLTDVDMPGISGIDLAQHIMEMYLEIFTLISLKEFILSFALRLFGVKTKPSEKLKSMSSPQPVQAVA